MVTLNEQVLKAKELFDQGTSLVDIAAALGVSPGTVRSWKSRYKWVGNTATQRNAAQECCNAKAKKRVSEISTEIIEPLNDNQRLFAEYYADNRNATQAYIRAYGANWASANTLGPRLLGDVRVRSYVDELLRLKREAIMLEGNDIVERYMRIAFANMTDFVEFGTEVSIKDGEPILATARSFILFKPSTEVDGGLICQIKQTKDGATVKLEDRQKALDWLAKYFNMFPQDKHKQDYDNKRLELQERAVRAQEQKARDDTGNDGTLPDLIEGLKQNE